MKCVCRNCSKDYESTKSRADVRGYCSAKCQHAKAHVLGYRKGVKGYTKGRNASTTPVTEFDYLKAAQQVGDVPAPFKPYELAWFDNTPLSTRPRMVQIISRPMDGEGMEGTIMVRMVPGDPTSIREVPLTLLRRLDANANALPLPKYRYVHIATVCSIIFDFPEDMLRYDNAALDNADLYEEAYNEDGDRRPEDTHPGRTSTSTIIYSVSDRAKPHWHLGRWSSFSCTVEHLCTLDLTDPDAMAHASHKYRTAP